MRLIDADELKAEGYHLTKEMTYGAHMVDLDKIETAYNVDKVITKLKRSDCKDVSPEFCNKHSECGNCIRERYHEIVREGGVE